MISYEDFSRGSDDRDLPDTVPSGLRGHPADTAPELKPDSRQFWQERLALLSGTDGVVARAADFQTLIGRAANNSPIPATVRALGQAAHQLGVHYGHGIVPLSQTVVKELLDMAFPPDAAQKLGQSAEPDAGATITQLFREPGNRLGSAPPSDWLPPGITSWPEGA